jgi:hypothetical protein
VFDDNVLTTILGFWPTLTTVNDVALSNCTVSFQSNRFTRIRVRIVVTETNRFNVSK